MADTESLSKEDLKLLRHRLYEAAGEGRVDDVSQLSTHFTGDVWTLSDALHVACEYGQLNVVKWLVSSDDEIDVLNGLDAACRWGQLNVVTWLVEQLELWDNGKCLGEALEWACICGCWNIVKWLVNSTQADVNFVNDIDYSDNCILHYVISFNPTDSLSHSLISNDMTELCRLVYVCGEDVNVQISYDGNTPLHEACQYNITGALLLAGADETITNDMGQTPVQWAKGRVEVLPLLDVSSKWKLLVRSHRLRRRTAVQVMMTLVKWKVQQPRNMWTQAIMTLHTIITCTVYTYRHNYQHMYTPRMYKRLRTNDSVAENDSATNKSRVDTSKIEHS